MRHEIIEKRVLLRLCRRMVAAAILLSIAAGGQAFGQIASLTLKKAAAATELPVGAWGPYSSAHIGPCFMASRKKGQMFAFPIVVGQQRDEILPIGSKTQEGRSRLRPERVTLIRRGLGLSATSAEDDAGSRPARAVVTEADGSGLLWSSRTEFFPAKVKEEVAGQKDANGLSAAVTEWGAGTAEVSYFPAFAEPDSEGLVVRVALSNRSDTEQSYFVDLYSGIESPDDAFSQQDLTWTVSPDGNGIAMKHSNADRVFAMEAWTGDFATRSYTVTTAVFTSDANICQRETTGALLPFGWKRDDPNAAVKNPASKPWGLLRASSIAVASGQTRVVFLCIGIGKDEEAAYASAQTFLSQADDFNAPGKAPRTGLFTLAHKEHVGARYSSGDSSLDRLMAQSLSNTPFRDFRRVGAPSRENGGRYRPGAGGWMALGWNVYRPDWAAAQLNAWYFTNDPVPEQVQKAPAIPPIDLFALWELVQRTHDRELLARFYPYAVWRYKQFLEAGRQKEGDWLFAWPAMKDNIEGNPIARRLEASKAEAALTYSPDYSAYVIRAARLLLACARILDKTGVETDRFSRDITSATDAMNKRLWDAKQGVYVSKPVSTPDPVTVGEADSAMQENGLDGLLPLIAGSDSLAQEQRGALLKNLLDETRFWGPAGLRSVSKAAADYQPESAFSGGVRFGAQWMFWKVLLDLGEGDRATQLAARILTSYHAACERSGGCPEWLNAETGAASGHLDYTGDSCALPALYEAYHRPGTVSCGWDTCLLDDHYDKDADKMRIVFRAEAEKPLGVLLCVMGKPNGKYTLKGDIVGTFTADANGVLSIPLPNDHTNQQVEIAPLGN